MDKQDELAAVIEDALYEHDPMCSAENCSRTAPLIAAAVRAYLGSDEVVEAIKRGIAGDVLAAMDDYDEVPEEHIFTRPRYEWIRMRLDTIARAAIAAIGGDRG